MYVYTRFIWDGPHAFIMWELFRALFREWITWPRIYRSLYFTAVFPRVWWRVVLPRNTRSRAGVFVCAGKGQRVFAGSTTLSLEHSRGVATARSQPITSYGCFEIIITHTHTPTHVIKSKKLYIHTDTYSNKMLWFALKGNAFVFVVVVACCLNFQCIYILCVYGLVCVCGVRCWWCENPQIQNWPRELSAWDPKGTKCPCCVRNTSPSPRRRWCRVSYVKLARKPCGTTMCVWCIFLNPFVRMNFGFVCVCVAFKFAHFRTHPIYRA